jgi:thioredoxin reductase (NADPH)
VCASSGTAGPRGRTRSRTTSPGTSCRIAGWTSRRTTKQPLVVFPDGTVLVDPTNIQIAEKLGRKTHAGLPFYDLVIVGGGPAGLAAAVYGASEGLKTLLVEREAPGGQAGTTSRIENYLGFPVGLSGADLTRRAVAQASRLGAEILSAQEATGLRITDTYRIVSLGDGTELSCQALLIATGVSYRRLDLPGIEPLTGTGVYYGAAITEAAAYRGESVAVVGGGNSAGQAAVYLVDQISATENVGVRLGASVVGVSGGGGLEAIEVEATGEASLTVPVSAMFVFIGQQPRTDWCAEVVERDPGGFILSGPALVSDGHRPKGWTPVREPYLLEASVPGVFVAGDVRSRSVKRIASAVGEGSMAVQFVHQYLAGV